MLNSIRIGTAHKRRTYRKVFVISCVVFLLLILVCTLAATITKYVSSPGDRISKNSGVTVDYSNASNGYIAVKHSSSSRKTKLQISSGRDKDNYDLACDDTYYYFPLKNGNGTYTIATYGQVSGTKYAQEYSKDISVKMEDPLSCYLYPNQRVWWDENSSVVELADQLCEGLTTDMQKVSALYKWVAKNISYDYIKAINVETTYLPDNEVTLEKKTGICYDYASLLAAMLRSQGIYTQLVTGIVNGNQTHAWNRVYIDGEWKMLDPTLTNKYGSSAYKMEKTF